MAQLKLGVKELVYFACRSGDLNADSVAGPTAREGQLTHKKLQALKTDSQQAEASLKVAIDVAGDSVVLGGRVDLLDRKDQIAEIIEIKSTYVHPQYLPASALDLHWSQLKVYGYLLTLLEPAEIDVSGLKNRAPMSQVRLQLACHNMLDDTTHRDSRLFETDELAEFTHNAIARYLKWYHAVEESRQRMRESATQMAFPFKDYRAGQYPMAASVYLTIKNRSRLLCEAPTGTGKTISTLFPACKALALGHMSQIVYMTAKTSGRQAAFAAIGKLQQAGLQATSLVIHSKVLACHCQNGGCERNNDGRCPRTIGFFDRLPEARERLLESASLDNEKIDEVAVEFELCPFELALQMLPWMDIVVCDYNYLFDPLVRLASFAEREKDIALLIDEAHNLSDRARGMYSAKLSSQQNQEVITQCKSDFPVVAKAAKALNAAMTRLAGEHELNEIALQDAPATVTREVFKCLEALEEQGQSNRPRVELNATQDFFAEYGEDRGLAETSLQSSGSWPQVVREWFKELFRYRVIEELYSETHRTLVVSQELSAANSARSKVERLRQEITVSLACIDASEKLTQSFSKVHSAVVFSATLRPQEYYLNTLGLHESAQVMSLPSPFASEQLACAVCSWIDTRFQARQQSAAALLDLIASVYRQRSGNYLVFFPSYAYMQAIHQQFVDQYPEISVVIQARSTEHSNTEFLSCFTEESSTLGFAIMGGVFGEGIDYQGDQLVGAIIVGTGLPGIGLQQKLLSEHFTSEGLDGFDYAFRYPGFTRVQQTAGRVIRSETDRGVVVLVDSRFRAPFYRSLYPDSWSPHNCSRPEVLENLLQSFWAESSEPLNIS